jgi:hypothetical protein
VQRPGAHTGRRRVRGAVGGRAGVQAGVTDGLNICSEAMRTCIRNDKDKPPAGEDEHQRRQLKRAGQPPFPPPTPLHTHTHTHTHTRVHTTTESVKG